MGRSVEFSQEAPAGPHTLSQLERREADSGWTRCSLMGPAQRGEKEVAAETFSAQFPHLKGPEILNVL